MIVIPTFPLTSRLGLRLANFLAAFSMDSAAPKSSFSAISIGSSGSTQSAPWTNIPDKPRAHSQRSASDRSGPPSSLPEHTSVKQELILSDQHQIVPVDTVQQVKISWKPHWRTFKLYRSIENAWLFKTYFILFYFIGHCTIGEAKLTYRDDHEREYDWVSWLNDDETRKEDDALICCLWNWLHPTSMS